MADDTNKILAQKIRNPRNSNDWLTTLYVTADQKIHLHGYLETTDAVSGENIQEGVISNSHIGKDTITGGEKINEGNIASNTIHQYNLAEEQMIDTKRLGDRSIVRDKIALEQITRSRIKRRHVGALQIGSKAIYPRHLCDDFFLIEPNDNNNFNKLIINNTRNVEEYNYMDPGFKLYEDATEYNLDI